MQALHSKAQAQQKTMQARHLKVQVQH